MLKSILKMLSISKQKNNIKNTGDDLRKGGWAEKQMKDMAKLRGKLILM